MDADTLLFGKYVGDLQENIVIGTNSISGRLLHVTDYTGFSSNPEEQEGNYLVIHITATGSNEITVELVDGVSGPRLLNEDGIIILRVTSTTQSVRVVSGDATKTFALTDLELEE